MAVYTIFPMDSDSGRRAILVADHLDLRIVGIAVPPISELERHQLFDDALLLPAFDIVEERQPQEAVTDVLRNRALPGPSAEGLAHARDVEGEIVEHSSNLLLLEMFDQPLASDVVG